MKSGSYTQPLTLDIIAFPLTCRKEGFFLSPWEGAWGCNVIQAEATNFNGLSLKYVEHIHAQDRVTLPWARPKNSWGCVDQKSELGSLPHRPSCLPSQGRDAVDNAAAFCGIQTKQFDSANRKVQLCYGKQMNDRKN